ncbi:hypothetical protein MMC19_006378 [Ptychographa xylographoides]|nr:hypothetical protein [Ptychographa xylographoides]
MKATIIFSTIVFMATSVLATGQVVVQVPLHAKVEYKAAFLGAPKFAEINHLSADNVAGFTPYGLPLAAAGLQGGSRIGIMMM